MVIVNISHLYKHLKKMLTFCFLHVNNLLSPPIEAGNADAISSSNEWKIHLNIRNNLS